MMEHAWSRTATLNIVKHIGLMFCMSICLGHLRCISPNCEFLSCVHRMQDINETEWEELSPTMLAVGEKHPLGLVLVCKICKEPPSCLVYCNM